VLGRQTVAGVIEIARRLIDAKEIAGHGGSLPWLDREFRWSEDSAERFIRVSKLAGQIPQVAEFDLPISGLYLLAAPSTPDAAREEIVDRAEDGEKITVADVKRAVKASAPDLDARPSRMGPNPPHSRLVVPTSGEATASTACGTPMSAYPTPPAKISAASGAVVYVLA
jgi:hypothetical protein